MSGDRDLNGSVHGENYVPEIKISVYSFYSPFLLGIQAIVPTLMNLTYIPLSLLTLLCILPDEAYRGHVIFSLLLWSGFATILQAAVGMKFPLMMSPSPVFVSGTVLFLKSPYWEEYSSGDLYSMGPTLRFEEYIARTSELRGFLILCCVVASVICGILWYLPLNKCSSATISATLISVSLSNAGYILAKKRSSLLCILAFMLPLGFYIIEKLKIPFPNKKKKVSLITLKIFRFSILLTTVILVGVNINIEEGYNSLLKRAFSFYNWHSINIPFKISDIILPKLSSRCLVLLPFFCSQFVTSYCCYQMIKKEKETYLKALFLENVIVAVSAGFGITIPLSVDPTSIGLLQTTRVNSNEPSIIAGGLLILCSMLVILVMSFSYISYPLLCGIILFLYGQLLTKGLKELKTGSTSIVALSVMSGVVLSSTPIKIGNNIFYSIIGLVCQCPSVVTFFISIMLSLAHKSRELHNK